MRMRPGRLIREFVPPSHQLHRATVGAACRPTVVVVLGVLLGCLCSTESYSADTPGGLGAHWTRHKSAAETLAARLDRLERHFQNTGRITVKAPDVWGQARLTAHREEFEEQMAAQLGAFAPTLNAEIAVSDQALVSQALSLSATVSGETAMPMDSATEDVTDSDTGVGDAAGGRAPSAPGWTAPRGHLQVPLASAAALGLEPEILLDQRKRFLDHLHEIRRINEGDDSTDSPGYSLNLVRLPVSILPGFKTRENYGAEVTVLAEPHLTEELLPGIFRELVVNDLVDQLALPIVKALDLTWQEHVQAVLLMSQVRELGQEHADLSRFAAKLQPLSLKAEQGTLTYQDLQLTLHEFGFDVLDFIPVVSADSRLEAPRGSGGPAARSWRNDLTDDVRQKLRRDPRMQAVLPGLQRTSFQRNSSDSSLGSGLAIPPEQVVLDWLKQPEQLAQMSDFQPITSEVLAAAQQLVSLKAAETRLRATETQQNVNQMLKQIRRSLGFQVPRERRSRYPVATSDMLQVFGEDEFVTMSLAVFQARDRFAHRDRVQLADVQGFLRNELENAYDIMNVEAMSPQPASWAVDGTTLWSPEWLPTVMEVRHPTMLTPKRQALRERWRLLSQQELATSGAGSAEEFSGRWNTLSAAMGWAILVESVLLNQQLNEDLQRVSQDPGCECVCSGEYEFYGPSPAPEARQVFLSYVRCRWPIRVFALDPVVQQQNIADSFSLRREAQLAAALAFSKGSLSANSLTRYMRRIEQDIRAIALNQTQVGFGAGNNTFGWRFSPRVQTPSVESNAKTVFRDLLWGGPSRDARIKQSQIEPGQRECVALVVMPSFVKHVRFDVRTRWFKLTKDCWHTGPPEDSLEESLQWSEELQTLSMLTSACFAEQARFLPGDVERLLRRSEQLAQQLPLRTLHAQVPHENTLGGFEMFASGITDLAPELVGFYGAPGVDPQRETVLFLVGDNFSGHQTTVIAGNLNVEPKLLSREVLQIVIPKDARVERRLSHPQDTGIRSPLEVSDDFVVEVRLATPYGVSSPLFVPVVLNNGWQSARPETLPAPVLPPAPAPLLPSSDVPAPITVPGTEPDESMDDASAHQPPHTQQGRLVYSSGPPADHPVTAE